MDEVCCTVRFHHLATDAMSRSTFATVGHSRRNPENTTLRPMVRPSLERLDPLVELTGQEYADLSKDWYPVLHSTGSSAM